MRLGRTGSDWGLAGHLASQACSMRQAAGLPLPWLAVARTLTYPRPSALPSVPPSSLASIEEMAGMNMLCSDKTGTLTLNKMVIQVCVWRGGAGGQGACL